MCFFYLFFDFIFFMVYIYELLGNIFYLDLNLDIYLDLGIISKLLNTSVGVCIAPKM